MKGSGADEPAVFALTDQDDDVVVLRIPSGVTSLRAKLTAAEVEVAELACAGLSNAAIAARRGSSVRTVANQFAAIFKKLSVASRHELIALVADGDLD